MYWPRTFQAMLERGVDLGVGAAKNAALNFSGMSAIICVIANGLGRTAMLAIFLMI
jgi:hypothetical protein